jgi:hypothetical protein
MKHNCATYGHVQEIRDIWNCLTEIFISCSILYVPFNASYVLSSCLHIADWVIPVLNLTPLTVLLYPCLAWHIVSISRLSLLENFEYQILLILSHLVVPSVLPRNAISIALILFLSLSKGTWGAHGSVVVKALCYKPEGRGFDTRRGDFFKFN